LLAENRHTGSMTRFSYLSAKQPSRITIPERCHPLAKIIFAEMKRQGVSYDELEFRSGVLRTTFKAWRTNNAPGISTVEAALGSLGWSLVPVPRFEVLPAGVRAGLAKLADEWGEDDEHKLLCHLLATVCRMPTFVTTDTVFANSANPLNRIGIGAACVTVGASPWPHDSTAAAGAFSSNEKALAA
jgi:hypothetical protein